MGAVAVGAGVVAGGVAMVVLAQVLLGSEIASLRSVARLASLAGGPSESTAPYKVGAVVAGGLLTAALVARMV